MSIFDRVKNNNFVCKVLLAFEGELIPIQVLQEETSNTQNYFNNNENEIKLFLFSTYFGKATLTFQEESSYTESGTKYTQKVVFTFPSNDENRSERLAKFKWIKYIVIVLNDGRKMLIGRNDHTQNAVLRPTFTSNEKLTQISIINQSITPVGFITE